MKVKLPAKTKSPATPAAAGPASEQAPQPAPAPMPPLPSPPVIDPNIVGEIVRGEFSEIFIRQKAGHRLEIGDLLVCDEADSYLILQVEDLLYGSQIATRSHELMAGLKLEGYAVDLRTMEPELRNYVVAETKSLVRVQTVKNGLEAHSPKVLPPFSGDVRKIKETDLQFLIKPQNPINAGQLRSGSKLLDVEVFLNFKDIIPHHVFIPATTGRGKSNLMKDMLWSVVDNAGAGLLILDPHDEYYGSTGLGLKDHARARDYVRYYTCRHTPPAGAMGLVVNVQNLTPQDFEGAADFSDAQLQIMQGFYSQHGNDWIRIMINEDPKAVGINPTAHAVILRKLATLFRLEPDAAGTGIVSSTPAIDTQTAGLTTIDDVKTALEQGKKVIIDTSQLRGPIESLIGNILVRRIFDQYQNYKYNDQLADKPVIGIVLEEAPRVLGEQVLKHGDNIFSTITKEGRKFLVGLIAISQLTSVIPKEILANMNTKIILGNENKGERDAIINNASQDLSSDSKIIQTMDKGEAIISSNFTRFAIPVKFPLFEDVVKESKKNATPRGTLAYDG